MSERDPKRTIADLNDVFRRQGRFVATPDVLSLQDVSTLMRAVTDYDTFNEDNDPYGKHDFGALDWEGNDVLWKIDYYDPTYTAWQDPLSDECHRMLTVMLGASIEAGR